MTQTHILKKSGKHCHPIPDHSTGAGMTKRRYTRLFIPYTEIEMRNRKDRQKVGHVVIAREDSYKRRNQA